MVLNVSAKQAWGVIAAGVLAYELACNEGELLSEGVDDWVATKPILTRAVIAALALHLGNPFPRASIRYRWDVTGFEKARGI
jgi:hypothetical protein